MIDGSLCCLGTVGFYYICHCFIFTRTLIKEHFDFLETENVVVSSEAEQLIKDRTIQVHENRILSLPKIEMEITERTIEDSFIREKYKPGLSYIRMHESTMLDVLYE